MRSPSKVSSSSSASGDRKKVLNQEEVGEASGWKPAPPYWIFRGRSRAVPFRLSGIYQPEAASHRFYLAHPHLLQFQGERIEIKSSFRSGEDGDENDAVRSITLSNPYLLPYIFLSFKEPRWGRKKEGERESAA